MKLIIPSRARKQIRHFSKDIQKSINEHLEALPNDPRPVGCLKIENEVDMWRIRVGEYRIAYQITKDIEIVRVTHRSKFYARKEL